jgi:Kdo2-lipid IVA lauroyltransferase/acyltransferase
MGSFFFYIFLALNRIITLLPLRILYLFSDLLYIIIYYLIRYRRKVVEANLKNSFPSRSASELKTIEKNFYKHLADLIVETLYLTNMSEIEQRKRITYSNLEIIEKLRNEKRDIAAITAHYNNWEWPTLLPHYIGYETILIYKPLQNKLFNDFMNKNRSKDGIKLTPTSLVIRDIINYRKNKINTFSVFISDQIPSIDDIKYWTSFMNQDTAVFTGAGKIAAKYDMAMVFIHIQKIKRGYYNIDFELLYDHTAGKSENELSETHVRRLEQIINEKPEYWIWSHRRWKHKRPVNNA